MHINVDVRQQGGMEVPHRFRLNGQQIDVIEILDQWFGADYRYCKIRGSNGALYILRLDETRSEWQLTMFALAQAPAVAMLSRGRRTLM